MTTTARTTKNATSPKSGSSRGTAVLAFLMIGAIVLIMGIAAVSSSHEDPGTVTCDRQTMQSGDTCTTYTNNAPTRTEGYDQMRAEHAADVQRDKTLGPVLIVVAVLLLGGGVVTGVAALSRDPRPSGR